jgi:hypothetical protein
VIKNTAFKDLYNNKCEIIVAQNKLPQKQYILEHNNSHEVQLSMVNNEWIVVNPVKKNYRTAAFGGLAILLLLGIVILLKKRNIG